MASTSAAEETAPVSSAPSSPSFKASLRLLHSCSAASTHPHSVLWLPSTDDDDDPPRTPMSTLLTFPSHAMINLARPVAGGDMMFVADTIRTSEDCGGRTITALAAVRPFPSSVTGGGGDSVEGAIAAAFSDGSLSLWHRRSREDGGDPGWEEYVVRSPFSVGGGGGGLDVASVTDLGGALLPSRGAVLITATCDGVWLHHYRRSDSEEGNAAIEKIGSFAAASVRVHPLPTSSGGGSNELLAAVGTAHPRHNRVHLYTLSLGDGEGRPADVQHRHHGALSGHTDWVTCLDFLDLPQDNGGGGGGMFLASGGQDARIRLWRFHPPRTSSPTEAKVSFAEDDDIAGGEGAEEEAIEEEDDDNDEDGGRRDEGDDYDEDEARLHVRHIFGTPTSTAVTFEALLIGHDEPITSVSWRPSSTAATATATTATVSKGRGRPTLMSSSMDRSILLWQADEDDENDEERGVWVPITRVGSAGGILGGSVGSSLMGYVDAAFDPTGDMIVGHGYGGSLHFWRCSREGGGGDGGENAREQKERWTACPPLTGHFRGVSDISWEASRGDFLLSAGLDQTCRMWAEVPLKQSGEEEEETVIWREVGRPQVHGYDMAAVCCIGGRGEGTGEPPHRYVSGSDEKELRVFDAPRATLRLLYRLRGWDDEARGEEREWEGGGSALLERVERAYLPSLGLSNRATAADALEEEDGFHRPNPSESTGGEDGGGDTSSEGAAAKRRAAAVVDLLPSERDLGVASLWPEARKLFGHDTELVCLASSLSSSSDRGGGATIVASSAKARGVDDAAIRLWDVDGNKCVGVLKGGHRSTVATMSFSPDGLYLASSGKDRRLCLWRKTRSNESSTANASDSPQFSFSLAAAVDSAHRRIVWSVHFCPLASTDDGTSNDGRRVNFLASGARDGTVKLWRIVEEGGGEVRLEEYYKFEAAPVIGGGRGEAVTAVAFAPCAVLPSSDGRADKAVFAVGTEGGRIGLWAVRLPRMSAETADEDSSPCTRLILAASPHADAVKKLAWRPVLRGSGDEKIGVSRLTFASCGLDHGVRIFSLTLQLVKTV